MYTSCTRSCTRHTARWFTARLGAVFGRTEIVWAINGSVFNCHGDGGSGENHKGDANLSV